MLMPNLILVVIETTVSISSSSSSSSSAEPPLGHFVTISTELVSKVSRMSLNRGGTSFMHSHMYHRAISSLVPHHRAVSFGVTRVCLSNDHSPKENHE